MSYYLSVVLYKNFIAIVPGNHMGKRLYNIKNIYLTLTIYLLVQEKMKRSTLFDQNSLFQFPLIFIRIAFGGLKKDYFLPKSLNKHNSFNRITLRV